VPGFRVRRPDTLRFALRLPVGHAQDASDRLLLPNNLDYEHSRHVDSRDGHRAFARLLLGDRAFHDATIRFGGPLELEWRTFSFLPPAEDAEPLTPLSPPLRTSVSLSLDEPFGAARPLPPPAREGVRLSRSGVPSIVR